MSVDCVNGVCVANGLNGMQSVQTYEYKKQGWYPHMMPRDVEIWERFLRFFPDMYDTVQYDVEVGTVPGFVEDIHMAEGVNMGSLYKRKIDVVGFKTDQIDVIEVKPRASTGAIGQVKAYRDLYVRDYNPRVTPKCIIVTNVMLPDMNELAAREGVLLVVV